MSIKKKLVMGAMSATLGISLVGGGTWAAFNDVEKVNNTVAAGQLKLELGKKGNKDYHFSIKDLKPGDSMTRTVVLKNKGTLAIKDVLMAVELVEHKDYIPVEGQAGFSAGAGENTALEYLDQFKISVMKVGAEGGAGGFPKNIISSAANITLKDFYLASDSVNGDSGKMANGATQDDINAARAKVWGGVDRTYIEDYRINVATINPDQWTGLPLIPKDDDNVEIKIEFINNTTDMTGGLYDQNIFQGDTANIKVSFEARQWGGLNVQDRDMNPDGEVDTNKKANSEEGNSGRP